MTEREALLNTKEIELAAREQTIVATLHAKDEEIEELVQRRTQKLEDEHKKAIEAQASTTRINTTSSVGFLHTSSVGSRTTAKMLQLNFSSSPFFTPRYSYPK